MASSKWLGPPGHEALEMETAMQLDFNSEKWKSFAKELDQMGAQMELQTGQADFSQLKKMERWGRLATILGYLTAWILPNPVSAYLISQGIFTRWALVFHPISHGAFDRMEGVPARYTSQGFAQGARRFLDWGDWMKPENWHVEHNILHHHYLGGDKDPDVVWRNAERIRTLPIPRIFRYFISLVIISIWKPFYYAANTVAEARHHRGLVPSNKISLTTWSLRTSEGRELWLSSLLPYALFRFLILPLAFFPLGYKAVMAVLLNTLVAEVMTNWHGFATIGPNHTGDDVYTFATKSRGKAEFYFRQIVGTINFPAGSEFVDFMYGGMNYQIEHHLWPKATLLQCQMVRPKLKELCLRYELPYNEHSLLPRVLMTVQTIAGSRTVLEFQAHLKGEAL